MLVHFLLPSVAFKRESTCLILRPDNNGAPMVEVVSQQIEISSDHSGTGHLWDT